MKFGVTKKVLDVLEKDSLDYELYSNIKPNPILAQSAYDDACRHGNPKETSVEDITKLYESLI